MNTNNEQDKTKIQKNGLVVKLFRKETDTRKKKGSDEEGEPISIWTFSLREQAMSQEHCQRRVQKPGSNDGVTMTVWEGMTEQEQTLEMLTVAETIMGSKAAEWLQGQIDRTLKTNQMFEGKDSLSMDAKLEKAWQYIGEGDFGRSRQSGVSAMVKEMASLKSNFAAMTARLMQKTNQMMQESDPVKKAALWNEVQEINNELMKTAV